MLTMMYVAGGFPGDEYEKRRAKRLSNKKTIIN